MSSASGSTLSTCRFILCPRLRRKFSPHLQGSLSMQLPSPELSHVHASFPYTHLCLFQAARSLGCLGFFSHRCPENCHQTVVLGSPFPFLIKFCHIPVLSRIQCLIIVTSFLASGLSLFREEGLFL